MFGVIYLISSHRYTQMSENQLSGPLPDEIKAMGNLQTFSVHNNDPGTGNHTGPLPKFDAQPFLNEV
jgi:hypothetical protein